MNLNVDVFRDELLKCYICKTLYVCELVTSNLRFCHSLHLLIKPTGRERTLTGNDVTFCHKLQFSRFKYRHVLCWKYFRFFYLILKKGFYIVFGSWPCKLWISGSSLNIFTLLCRSSRSLYLVIVSLNFSFNASGRTATLYLLRYIMLFLY